MEKQLIKIPLDMGLESFGLIKSIYKEIKNGKGILEDQAMIVLMKQFKVAIGTMSLSDLQKGKILI